MKNYAVIYEQAGINWPAYSPDVPGCAATGATREEVEANFQSALEFHFDGLRLHNLPVPQPKSQMDMILIAA